MCITPITTRAIVKYASVSTESIPDLTLCMASILGILSWSLMGAIYKGGSKNMEEFAEQGFAILFKKTKKPQP